MAGRHYGTAIGAIALAGLVGLAVTAGDVPYPDIPPGQGKFCVEDTEFMRRNHMEILLHQRDDTVHLGLRSKPHSLKECIDCHAVLGADSLAVTVDDPSHFCRSCHDYAAVNIDCFDCHASRPALATRTESGASL